MAGKCKVSVGLFGKPYIHRCPSHLLTVELQLTVPEPSKTEDWFSWVSYWDNESMGTFPKGTIQRGCAKTPARCLLEHWQLAPFLTAELWETTLWPAQYKELTNGPRGKLRRNSNSQKAATGETKGMGGLIVGATYFTKSLSSSTLTLCACISFKIRW